MGIDAEILLRFTGPKPDDNQIALWSDGICRSIGAKHFFISDGLPPEEYRKAEKAWHEAFRAHPLHSEYEAANKRDRWPNYSPEANAKWQELGNQIRADIGKCPEQRRRAIELTNHLYPIDEEDESVPVEYREPGRCWTQDGDPIFAKPGEWFLKVNCWSRFYGIGYERGDLLTLCAIAEWCEINIPNCVVWYGGDSSGELAQPWPDSERLKLRYHLYSPKGREYFKYSSRYGQQPKHPSPCGLCIDGGSFEQYGSGGGGYIGVHCASCGKSFESRDHGVTWEDKKEAA
jgi:hypothetical protein